MAITVAGVTGKEMWDSFRKGRTNDGPFVSLSYLVDFADADRFVDGCLGGVVVSGESAEYVPKLLCPTNPSLYAMRAEFVGVGQTGATDGGRPTFNHAVVEVTFEIPNWPQFASDDPGGIQSFPIEATPGQPLLFAECEIDYGGDLVTIPERALVFTSDSKPIGQNFAKFVGVSTYRIVRHYFPRLPHAKIKSLRNRLNNSTFLGEDRGKVLFAGGKTRAVKTSDGVRVQNFELTFMVRDEDWNYFIRPDDGTFDEVSDPADSTNTPYKYADLSPLLANY